MKQTVVSNICSEKMKKRDMKIFCLFKKYYTITPEI